VSASEDEEDGIQVAILERLPDPTYEYLCSELNFEIKGWSNGFFIRNILEHPTPWYAT
jgi:hypothetical protein